MIFDKLFTENMQNFAKSLGNMQNVCIFMLKKNAGMVMAMLQCFVVQIVFIISMVSFTLFTNHAAHRIDQTQISGFRPVKGLRVIS